MSKIMVAKLVRLGINGNNFDKKLIAKVERTNAKIDDEQIERFNQSWKTSGRLYIVDEDLTKERNNELAKKAPKADDNSKAIREALKAEADDLGIEYKKNIKTEALSVLISEAKENQ